MTSTDTRPVVSTIVSGRTGWQLGRTGQLIRPRYLVATAVILVLMATFVVVSVTTGTLTIPAGRLVPALLGLGEPAENLIMAKRGSRSLLGLLVGFALGVAGGITQSLVRNPLASPDILGVTSGASLFAVAVILTPPSPAWPPRSRSPQPPYWAPSRPLLSSWDWPGEADYNPCAWSSSESASPPSALPAPS